MFELDENLFECVVQGAKTEISVDSAQQSHCWVTGCYGCSDECVSSCYNTCQGSCDGHGCINTCACNTR